MDKLSKILKKAREEKEITQLEVNEKLGWGRSCVYSHIENCTKVGKGKKYLRIPQKNVVKKMAKILDIPYDDLVKAVLDRMIENKKELYFD